MRKVTGAFQLKRALKALKEVDDILWGAEVQRIDYYNEKTENWRYQDRGCHYFDTTEMIEDYRYQLREVRNDLEEFIATL